ncbi:D-alanyl-D-alanine carboxypeptidase family protein [uncultured Anaerofustis sp.]|uniref:D-alanyl-D-alanine carboxypeptidase family protein n=1 Tax=uncultured Anaerofustis sp. TaxID=904996 RepID=UPI0025ED1B62|nr:D-alanyl-D-alanine carboxypeptidase family protein [uncultured Anaerofustis sp.]
MRNKNILKRTLSSFLIVVVLLLNITSNIYAAAPKVSKDSSIGLYLYEDSTKSELYSHNGNKKMYPASTTKIMTAALTLEYIKDLNKKVTTGSELNRLPAGSSTASLYKNETLSYKDLLYGLMLPSGNDAAIVLACNVGKVINKDKNISKDKAYNVFVKEMNKKAKEIGMSKTHFNNPHGFHDKNHYSTPHDMALLAAYADDFSYYNRVVDSTYYETTTNKTTHRWSGHNALILRGSKYFYKPAKGDKTGYTGEAGKCVVGSSENDQGIRYYAVVLHSPTTAQQFGLARDLLKYGNEETAKLTIEEEGDTLYKYTVRNLALGEQGAFKVKVNKDIEVYADKKYTEDNFTISFEPSSKYLKKTNTEDYELVNSISEDDKIGKINVYLNGKFFKSVDAFSKNDVDMRSTRDIIITNALIMISLLCLIIMALVLSSRYRTKKRIQHRKNLKRARLKNEIKTYGSRVPKRRPSTNDKGQKIKVVKKKNNKSRPMNKNTKYMRTRKRTRKK